MPVCVCVYVCIHYDGLCRIQGVFLLLQHPPWGLSETDGHETFGKIQFYVTRHQTSEEKHTSALFHFQCTAAAPLHTLWVNGLMGASVCHAVVIGR